jgi:hypothetical protein
MTPPPCHRVGAPYGLEPPLPAGGSACLALGGAYHPLGTAFPSSPTLGADDVRSPGGGIAGPPGEQPETFLGGLSSDALRPKAKLCLSMT